MATFTVTTNREVVDATDGVLSLREAVTQANADGAADEIAFAAAVQFGAIFLTGGELLVTSDLAIDGGPGGVRLNAGEGSRVLHIDGAGADVSIQRLAVAGGAVDGFGGGILAEQGTASLTIADSLVANDRTTGDTGSGGGVASFAATTTVVNSTVLRNTTAGDEAFGAGIFAVNRLVLTDATVSANRTLGAKEDGASVDGVGVFVGGTAEVNDSIIVGNNGVGLPNNVGGRPFTSNGHNLFGSDVSSNVAGDLENVGAAAVFARTAPVPGGTPVLGGALSDYGGPTDTVALLDAAANPALGRGSAGGPDTDQRGEPRPAPPGTVPDIGAFESLDAPPTVVGGARGERLVGTADDEHLRGLAGDDRLFGRGAGDRLDGGPGRDRLHGGGDGDLLHGGPGADRFVFRRPDHSSGDEQDLVLDFSRRQGDRLDLRGLDGDPCRAGDQRLEFVGTDGFRDAGEVRYTTEDGHTAVEVNLDRDDGAELAFRLDRAVDLHPGDFLL
jgi:hypothetical protein